jgi:hypothetical protein
MFHINSATRGSFVKIKGENGWFRVMRTSGVDCINSRGRSITVHGYQICALVRKGDHLYDRIKKDFFADAYRNNRPMTECMLGPHPAVDFNLEEAVSEPVKETKPVGVGSFVVTKFSHGFLKVTKLLEGSAKAYLCSSPLGGVYIIPAEDVVQSISSEDDFYETLSAEFDKNKVAPANVNVDVKEVNKENTSVLKVILNKTREKMIDLHTGMHPKFTPEYIRNLGGVTFGKFKEALEAAQTKAKATEHLPTFSSSGDVPSVLCFPYKAADKPRDAKDEEISRLREVVTTLSAREHELVMERDAIRKKLDAKVVPDTYVTFQKQLEATNLEKAELYGRNLHLEKRADHFCKRVESLVEERDRLQRMLSACVDKADKQRRKLDIKEAELTAVREALQRQREANASKVEQTKSLCAEIDSLVEQYDALKKSHDSLETLLGVKDSEIKSLNKACELKASTINRNKEMFAQLGKQSNVITSLNKQLSEVTNRLSEKGDAYKARIAILEDALVSACYDESKGAKVVLEKLREVGPGGSFILENSLLNPPVVVYKIVPGTIPLYSSPSELPNSLVARAFTLGK